MSQRLTETPQDAIEQHIRRSVQPHIEDATRLVDRPFDNNTPEQVVGWLRSIHSHPRMSDRHLHAIADHFGVQTRHLASRDDIVYRIGEAMRDRALSAGAPDIVTAEEVVDDDTPIDEPVAESLDDSDLENGVVEMPPPVQDTDTPHQPQTEQGRLVIESLRLIAHRLRHSGDPRHARHANQVTELISDLLDGEPLDARDVFHSLPPSAQGYPEWSVLADMAEAEEMAARASDDEERKPMTQEEVSALAQHWPGVPSKDDFAGLLGKSREGDSKAITVSQNGLVTINLTRADGTLFDAHAEVGENGERVFDVHYFKNSKQNRGRGFGRDDMRTMYESAQKLGVRRIQTVGARSADMIGYDLWPRMGFDAELNSRTRQKLPQNLQHARTLQDLQATPEGRAWWTEHGFTHEMALDLSGDGPGTKRFLELIGVQKSPERAARREARKRNQQ